MRRRSPAQTVSKRKRRTNGVVLLPLKGAPEALPLPPERGSVEHILECLAELEDGGIARGNDDDFLLDGIETASFGLLLEFVSAEACDRDLVARLESVGDNVCIPGDYCGDIFCGKVDLSGDCLGTVSYSPLTLPSRRTVSVSVVDAPLISTPDHIPTAF